jgi:hypothetical protein
MIKFLESDIGRLILDKGLLALVLAIAGFLFSRSLERFKAHQTKELERLRAEQALFKEHQVLRGQTRLKHLQRQIEELYSPLLGLVQSTSIVYSIAQKKLFGPHPPPNSAEIWRYFVESYFLPINAQIAELIRTKISLLETDELPASFTQFLEHQTHYECLHRLWKQLNVTSDEITGPKWPLEFEHDVRVTLQMLRRSYNEYRREIQVA